MTGTRGLDTNSLIAQVRSFNRTITERVGALNDHFLARNHPLGEARLLWEIGTEGVTVREVRRRLGLDSAYTSRLLRALERQGLIRMEIGGDDKRMRTIRLTSTGVHERAELDRRAGNFAKSLLEPLRESQRARLVAAMAQVEKLLTASMVDIRVANPNCKDARWCLKQYFAELDERFQAGFDPAHSGSARAHELTPPAGLFLVAYLRGEPVGCGGLKFLGNKTADIKRMWVAPNARGLGLGKRLLSALEFSAREAGITTLHLETNRALMEAITMYRESGYHEVKPFNEEPYAHYWFEKRI